MTKHKHKESFSKTGTKTLVIGDEEHPFSKFQLFIFKLRLWWYCRTHRVCFVGNPTFEVVE